MADLHTARYLLSVTTQGRQDTYNQWVTSYKLQYSLDAIQFHTIQDANGNERIFDGNTDPDTHVTHMLPLPTQGRYVRLIPLSQNIFQALRWGVSGF